MSIEFSKRDGLIYKSISTGIKLFGIHKRFVKGRVSPERVFHGLLLQGSYYNLGADDFLQQGKNFLR